jgi:hypothetical protein
MEVVWITVFLALFLGFGVWSSILSRRVGQLEDKLKGADKPVHTH